MRIDSHHHFWKYSSEEYDWIDDSMSVIRRDFLPADLKREIAAAGIDGVVSVQARQTVDETRWLLEMATQHDFIRGVVGWVPLIAPDIENHLAEFAHDRRLKAVRHVVQDEEDDEFILRPDFNRGVSLLDTFGLAYDILIFERHLPQTIQFVDRHPQQVFVLDHIAKPRIRDGALNPWAANIRELAKRENVYCKLSGMVTEADVQHWIPGQLRPYVEVVLESFGPRRVMFGSDWPVCLLGVEYGRWVSTVVDFLHDLSADERARVMGETAIEAYRLT